MGIGLLFKTASILRADYIRREPEQYPAVTLASVVLCRLVIMSVSMFVGRIWISRRKNVSIILCYAFKRWTLVSTSLVYIWFFSSSSLPRDN